MKKLYFKLALTNMKNSKQICLPYLLTGILAVAMFYNMVAIQSNEGVAEMPHASDLKLILLMGVYVIAIFVVIFLFYTNSFIIKRRKKELGVYNILGMEKKHIAKVLMVETFLTAFSSIGGGLLVGIVFNKLILMILYRLISFSSPIQFSISTNGIQLTIILFGVIYLCTLIYNMMQVKLSKPIELLHGGNVGEKEPKTKVFLTIVGLLCVGSGYFIAITTENPISAISLFFVAVELVIIGTYCLFIAGSIAFLKMLRKNKKYYYQSKHFTSISGMIYRMKQNAVGLANICILSTMVMVMLSATTALFLGEEEELDSRYSTEISITGYYTEGTTQDQLKEAVEEQISACGRTITYETAYFELCEVAVMNDNQFIIGDDTLMDFTNAAMITILTIDDFRANYNLAYEGNLDKDEIVLIGTPHYPYETLNILNREYNIVYQSEELGNLQAYQFMLIQGNYYLLVSNEAELNRVQQQLQEVLEDGDPNQMMQYEMSINIDGTPEEKLECEHVLRDAIYGENNVIAQNCKAQDYQFDARQLNADSFYVVYGGLFFLGMFLGIMFLMVTVLIIFYKQISEGYEDKERYAIMEKVGMSNDEVKRTISSQIRMVFFLPIGVAAIHVIAAFPMICRILAMFNLTNIGFFALCVLGTVGAFALIYLTVFLLTSRSYYKIVGNQIS